MAFEFRLDPNRKELCSKIALFDLLQIDMTFAYRRLLAQVKIFVQEALWCVSVGIYDEGRLVDCRRRISLRPRYWRGPGGFLMLSWMLCERKA